MPPHLVLLADDHPATLETWRSLLAGEFEVIGAVGDGAALVDAYRRQAPDVVVADIGMPGLNGLAAVETIIREHPGARVVIVTAHADRTLVRRAFAVGALGYVHKLRTREDLLPAVRAALADDVHISPLPPVSPAKTRHEPRR